MEFGKSGIAWLVGFKGAMKKALYGLSNVGRREDGDKYDVVDAVDVIGLSESQEVQN